uniref:MHC class II beta chain N-terminal domain-containing protein n=1 Tax=Oryzias sinensis TaxID=183150 RepID=A0A8C7Y3T6_9TELE
MVVSVSSSDAFLRYDLYRCEFNSTELEDIEFIYSMYYNRKEFMRFSSSLGRFVGYTEHGVKNAERANKDPSILSGWKAQKERYCKQHIDIWYNNMLSKSVVPRVRVQSLAPSGGHHPAMLVCS